MATFVTKKDGTKLPFDPEKIKAAVVAACLDAELANEEADKIAIEILNLVVGVLKDVEEVSTTEVRDKVLAELEMLHPNIAEAWKKYETTKVIE
ncbi:MAG: hypothetical protein EXS52_00675 [Candidatus Staskawiczbacteria bacterium]|nr:hypothetical protein [Candidatus Staskawiczbacteria bacterium]